jgi:hypothetical protein
MRKRIGNKPAAGWDLIHFLSWLLLLLAVLPPLFFSSPPIYVFFFVFSHSNTAPQATPNLAFSAKDVMKQLQRASWWGKQP